MSGRFFHIGNFVYSIANESTNDTAEVLWRKLSAAECPTPDEPPEVRFIFRDRIESPGEPIARISRTAIGAHSITFQVKSRLRMQLYPDWHGGLDAIVSEGRYPFWHEIAHRINKRWKYYFRYGLALNEGLAQKVLYSGLLPMLALLVPKFQMALVTAAAAVAPDGKALLIAGRRGTGRTALLGHLLEQGWQFLGDDVVAVGADGTVYPLALPLHIYAHHRQSSPRLVERMTAAMDPVELSLWQRAAWLGGAERLRWMRAERLWGAEKMAKSAPLGKVLLLQRETKRETAEWQTCPPETIVRTLQAMLLEEFRHIPALCVLGNAAVGAELLPDLGASQTAIGKVLTAAFQNVPHEAVHLPEKTDYAALADKLVSAWLRFFTQTHFGAKKCGIG